MRAKRQNFPLFAHEIKRGQILSADVSSVFEATPRARVYTIRSYEALAKWGKQKAVHRRKEMACVSENVKWL